LKTFAQFVIAKRLFVALGVLLVSGAATLGLPVDYDDDVIRFLPVDDPEVVRLEEITEKFGSTNIVLIGVETDNLYTKERLQYVRGLTDALKSVPLVEHVTSVSHLTVPQGAEGLTKVIPDPIPDDPKALEDARKFVTSLDYIVGQLISKNGGSTRLIVQMRRKNDDGSNLSPQRAAEAIRDASLSFDQSSKVDGVELHFGGAPFIAEAAARGSQEDLKRLSPYLMGIILLLILLIVGSLSAALMIVVSVGVSIWWTIGLMGLLGFPFTLVSSSLPVILFALGSAYAVHLLVWYLEHDADIEDTLIKVGWPIVVTALTTMAGFASFALMDIAPMREFGWQMVLGTAMCALVSLVVIPVTLAIWPLKPATIGKVGKAVDRALMGLVSFSRKRRWVVIGTGAIIAGFFALQIPHIKTNMDPQSFFPEGSAPDRANKFMLEEFGASIFLSVLVEADMRDPAVLKRLAVFEDRVEALEGVASVNSIGRVLAITREGMGKPRLLSYARDENDLLGRQARVADAAVRLLVDEPWDNALIQVGVGVSDTAKIALLTEEIRRLADEEINGYAHFVPRSKAAEDRVIADASARIAAMLEKPEEATSIETLLRSPMPPKDIEAMRKDIAAVIDLEVFEDEMFMVKEDIKSEAMVARAIDDLLAYTLTDALFLKYATAIADPEELEEGEFEGFKKSVGLVHQGIRTAAYPYLPGSWVKRIESLYGTFTLATKRRVYQIIDECFRPVLALHSKDKVEHGAKMTAAVSGIPVIEEAMTRSVKRNQIHSLVFSLPLVLLIMMIVFKSVILGLIGLLPTALTLLVTFGLMGLLPDVLPLDIAASMLASIGLGVGIDYAIHFLWRYREQGLEGAMATTGRSIVVNAAEITAGFSVLAFATISPMAKFGILTAETLFVAGTATLILLPALLDWLSPVKNVDK
jgi:uncharacterized protein